MGGRRCRSWRRATRRSKRPLASTASPPAASNARRRDPDVGSRRAVDAGSTRATGRLRRSTVPTPEYAARLQTAITRCSKVGRYAGSVLPPIGTRWCHGLIRTAARGSSNLFLRLLTFPRRAAHPLYKQRRGVETAKALPRGECARVDMALAGRHTLQPDLAGVGRLRCLSHPLTRVFFVLYSVRQAYG